MATKTSLPKPITPPAIETINPFLDIDVKKTLIGYEGLYDSLNLTGLESVSVGTGEDAITIDPSGLVFDGTNMLAPIDSANLLPDQFSTFEYFDDDETVGTVAVPADGTSTCTVDDSYSQANSLELLVQNEDGTMEVELGDAAGDYSGYYIRVLPSTNYIISTWAKADANCTFRFRVVDDEATEYLASETVKTLTSTWARYYFKFTTSATASTVKVFIDIVSSS